MPLHLSGNLTMIEEEKRKKYVRNLKKNSTSTSGFCFDDFFSSFKKDHDLVLFTTAQRSAIIIIRSIKLYLESHFVFCKVSNKNVVISILWKKVNRIFPNEKISNLDVTPCSFKVWMQSCVSS